MDFHHLLLAGFYRRTPKKRSCRYLRRVTGGLVEVRQPPKSA
jgi:hypothetical protein